MSTETLATPERHTAILKSLRTPTAEPPAEFPAEGVDTARQVHAHLRQLREANLTMHNRRFSAPFPVKIR